MENLPIIVAVIAFSGILYAVYDAVTHKTNFKKRC
jgi:hypothetical protein